MFICVLCTIYDMESKLRLPQVWIEEMGVFVELHVIFYELGEDLVEMLPAVHSLTGCDTTSKIGTKSKALAVMKTCMHLELKRLTTTYNLNERCIHAGEQFLLKWLPKSADVYSFDSMRYSRIPFFKA